MNLSFDNNMIVIILGFIFITVEIILGAATGFDLLLTGVIFIISGVIGLLVSSFNIALICIIVLILLYVVFGRRFIKTRLSIKTTDTNVDGIIGKKGVVTKKILVHSPGQVKIEGEIWRAESEKEIKENEQIVVKSVSGVTLKVDK